LFLLPLLLGAVVASLVAGILSDRYGRKLLVYIAGGLQAAAALFMILFPSMSFAVVLGFVFGLGYGAFQSVDFALAADVLPDKETAGKDLGVWHLAVICASSVGPLVAGLLLDAFKAVGMTAFGSPRLGYIVIFSVAVCLFILSTVLVSRMSVGGRPTPQTVDQAETIDFENTNDTEDVVADTDDDIAMEEKKQV
jgi:MFS family permease